MFVWTFHGVVDAIFAGIFGLLVIAWLALVATHRVLTWWKKRSHKS